MSFTDPCWVRSWLELRDSQGLRCGRDMPVMPAPKQDGSWSKVPLSVGAASEWLRALVKAPSEGPSRIAILTAVRAVCYPCVPNTESMRRQGDSWVTTPKTRINLC